MPILDQGVDLNKFLLLSVKSVRGKTCCLNFCHISAFPNLILENVVVTPIIIWIIWADLEIVVDPGSPTPSNKLGWQKLFD